MKQLFVLTLFFIISSPNWAQIIYKPGFFISTNGERIECLIKDEGWKNNPTNFQYRLTEGAAEQTASLNDVLSFGIEDHTRYERWAVEMDRSSELAGRLSKQWAPEFEQETLFLRLLIQGKFSLYYYEDGELTRFFLRESEAEPQQLVYKVYQQANERLASNYTFRGQLQERMSCSQSLSYSDLLYTQKQMLKAFERYYECASEERTVYMSSLDDIDLRVNLRAGIGLASTQWKNSFSSQDLNFGIAPAIRFGFELEVILPYQRKKWAVMVEPSYHTYSNDGLEGSDIGHVEYSSLELSSGIRHFFYINPGMTLFANSSIVIDFPFKSATIAIYNNSGREILSVPTLSFGIGARFKDLFSAELRYNAPRNLTNRSSFTRAPYKRFLALNIGYTMF